jgi:hypothetical protein
MKIWLIFILTFVMLIGFMAGCGDDGLITLEKPSSYSLSRGDGVYAVDLPSAVGTQWTYVNEKGSFNLTITKTYMVSGLTCRVLENSSDMPIDYLSASGRYLTINGQFVNYPLRVKRTYFYKDISGYYEMGFDMELPELGLNLVHQVHHPRRLIWKFPFRVGDEWEVFNKENFPEFKLVRRVISYSDPVEIPGGRKKAAYLIEEFSSSFGEELPDEPVARYWFVPNVGVARYEYLDEFSGNWVSYKLSDLFIPRSK